MSMLREPAPEVIITQQEEVAYGFIIEVLTRGLYPNKFHVVREYVQNSFDAILAWRKSAQKPKAGTIKIRAEKPSIFIYDDGTGMDRDKIRQYRYVGYSEKRTGEAVGFRGIGKLSGISVAEKLIVTTSPLGLPERYQLVFDAEAMLTKILALKATGGNIALNQLIQDHTTIRTYDEDVDEHYTQVELHKVRNDASDLLDQGKLIDYLTLNAPVEFDPAFEHGSTIDERLRELVPDYHTVSITVNGQPAYKPFFHECKPPQINLVLDDTKEGTEQIDGEDGDGYKAPNLLACYWYCEHVNKGQFKDTPRRGFFYRVKNFAVGDNQLPRTTLWKYSPERSFYFFGEIHVCDPSVIPSSERANFEQNEARENLYRLGRTQIADSLNRIAGVSSDTRRAKDFIEAAEVVVQETEAAFKSGTIPREAQFNRLVDLHNSVEQVAKRIRNAPSDYQERGQKVMSTGRQLVEKLAQAKPREKKGEGIYDIKTTLNFDKSAARLYDIVIDVLKDELIDRPQEYERILKRIHSALEERWQVEVDLNRE
jgi:hypothetical protein